VSDWFSRRLTLCASAFFTTCALAIYCVADGFLQFLPAEICFALGMSLYSGTLESVAYESCPAATRSVDGPRVLGNLQEWYFVTLAVYGIGGAFVAQWWGPVWTIALAAAVTSTSVVAAWLLVEPERRRASDAGLRASAHMRDIFSGVLRSRALLFNFLAFACLLAVNRLGFWYYQPVMAAGGLDLVLIGIVFSLFYLFSALGNRLARFLSARVSALSALCLQFALLVIGFAIMSRWTHSFGWIGILFPRIAFGMTNYLQPAEINAIASDDRRATIHSIASLVSRVVYAALLFVCGAFVADLPLPSTLLAFAGVSLALAAIVVPVYALMRPASPPSEPALS
jgi:MFS family permease